MSNPIMCVVPGIGVMTKDQVRQAILEDLMSAALAINRNKTEDAKYFISRTEPYFNAQDEISETTQLNLKTV